MLKAVILAAGRGTRMKELTSDQPKPMIDVGKGRLLEQVILAIRDAGVQDFIVVTGYHANIIEDHFGDGAGYNIQIEYVRQPVRDGTAGALRLTRDAVGNSPFFMSFGDVVCSRENYGPLIEDYYDNPVPIVLSAYNVGDPYAGAAVYMDEKTRCVLKVIEKPPKGTSTTPWNQAGLFVFEPGIFDYLDKVQLSPRGEYELTDAVHMSLADGLMVRAFPLRGFWGDIGTPEDVERLRRLFKMNENFLIESV